MKRAFTISVVLATAACASDHPPTQPEVIEVLVSPISAEIDAGGELQFQAQANDARGTAVGGAELRFIGADSEGVEVSPLGKVRSLGQVGEMTIEVHSGARRAAAKVRVHPGPVAHLESVAGDRQAGVVHAAVPLPLRVVAQDAFRNPVPGVSVSLHARPGLAPLAFAVSNSAGIASIVWTLGTSAGIQRSVVAALSGPEAAFSATAAPGPVRALRAFEENVSDLAVQALDAYGNPVPGVEVAWSLSGKGALSAARSTTDAAGIARTTRTGGDNAVVTARAPGAPDARLVRR